MNIRPKIDVGGYIAEFERSEENYFIGSKKDGLKRAWHNKERYLQTGNMLQHLLSQTGVEITLLDIGTSPFTFMLKRNYPKMKIHSIDYTDKYRDVCKKEGVIFQVVNLENTKSLIPKVKFKIILFLETIEHLRDNHYKVMNKVANSLTTDGYCIMSTPNRYSPIAQLSRNKVFNKIWSSFTQRPKTSDELVHAKEYSLNELIKLVEKNEKLELVKAKHVMFFDVLESTIIYRKNKLAIKPFLYLNLLFTKLIPIFRRGMIVVFRKI